MLIVENGSGIVGADSYVSVEQADTYHRLMGNTGWTQPPAPTIENPTPEDPNTLSKEVALRRGAVYLDAVYGSRLFGDRKNAAQGLALPQIGITYWDGRPIDPDTVPIVWQSAATELALLVFTGVPLTMTTPAGEKELIRKKIDSLEWSWQPGTTNKKASLGWIDAMLTNILGPPVDDGEMLFGRIVRG